MLKRLLALFLCYNHSMTDENSILQNAEKLVYDKLHMDTSGHDWWHMVRVRNIARELAEKEGANQFICELAALLHDMVDDKLIADPEKALIELKVWLVQQELVEETIKHIIQIIMTMSFKGNGQSVPSTLEGKIVQDADRLDAIGAIGIARCMAYSGSKGRPIHDPSRTVRDNLSLEDYRSGQDIAIMHFYEKLLKLKALMNTPSARKIAEHRHKVLEDFLTEFYAEWAGKL